MESLSLEDNETLDFFSKYGLIIANFIIIIVLLIYNKFFRKSDDINATNTIHNILIVISNPKDLLLYK